MRALVLHTATVTPSCTGDKYGRSLAMLTEVILGLYGVILGLYWDNGKYTGNYYLGFRVHVEKEARHKFKASSSVGSGTWKAAAFGKGIV